MVSNEAVHSVAEIVLVDAEKVTTGVLEEHLEEVAFKALPKDLAIVKNPEITLSTNPEAKGK
ncbi:MAG: hypothetical protein Q4F98_06030 [Lachnospiraceae bacterium]|nr:hypothetical protein [Lachnospiraceae bacterium]